MKPIVSYLRVSTERQGKSGLGIDSQRVAIDRFAAAEGFTIIADFEETETGKGADALERRPKLAAALAAAKRAKCPVLVSKLDRLSRDVHFISGLMAHRVPFVVTELGENVDPFMLHIYAAVAEKERQMIAERTRAALAAKKTAGAVLGNTKNLSTAQRLGADVNRRKADDFAARVFPIIRPMQDQGKSLNEIARHLNMRGVRTARGGSWTAKTIANVLSRQEQS